MVKKAGLLQVSDCRFTATDSIRDQIFVDSSSLAVTGCTFDNHLYVTRGCITNQSSINHT